MRVFGRLHTWSQAVVNFERLEHFDRSDYVYRCFDRRNVIEPVRAMIK